MTAAPGEIDQNRRAPAASKTLVRFSYVFNPKLECLIFPIPTVGHEFCRYFSM